MRGKDLTGTTSLVTGANSGIGDDLNPCTPPRRKLFLFLELLPIHIIACSCMTGQVLWKKPPAENFTEMLMQVGLSEHCFLPSFGCSRQSCLAMAKSAKS